MHNKGFLDWQILSVLWNFVISTKVNIILQRNPPSTQEEAVVLTAQLSTEMLNQPEEQNYIPIPLQWLNLPEFSFYMDKMSMEVLNSFGLENGMKHPNFIAVRNYLSKRFGFGSDDNLEQSSLKYL